MMYNAHSDPRHPGHASPGGSEPMALGSPVSSPTAAATQGNVSFLPPYLIGDVSSHVTPSPVHSWNTTPGKQGVGTPLSTSRLSPLVPRRELYQSPVVASNIGSGPNVGKPGGPPVRSLFSSTSIHGPQRLDFKDEDPLRHGVPPLDASNTSALDNQPQQSGVLSPSKSFVNSSLNNSNFMSPAQLDPFYTQGESLTSSNQLDETWVTVFGFPPASTNYILQQFAQYGKITDHKLATSGNWIHVKYQSKLQAKKALSKNGKVFGGSIMVGVKACIEMDVMSCSGKENSIVDTSANFCLDPLASESFDSGRRGLGNIRKLTQVYKTPNSDIEVMPKQSQANVNLVTRALGYVLKW